MKEEMLQEFPNEYIKIIDDMYSYTIYKTPDNNLLYAFICKVNASEIISHYAIVEKSMVESDFDNLKKGDPAEKMLLKARDSQSRIWSTVRIIFSAARSLKVNYLITPAR